MSFERRKLPRYRFCTSSTVRSSLTTIVVRFVPKGNSNTVLIGQPVDSDVDVGAAIRKGEEVQVKVFSGSSVLDAGSPTDKVEVIDRVLSPLTQPESGTVRCIGLNYKEHAKEAGMDLPVVPVVFLFVSIRIRRLPHRQSNECTGSRRHPWQTLGRPQP